MAYQNLPGYPFAMVGAVGKQGLPIITALASATLDAALESCQMIGRIYTSDGASHTIDTTGSSSIQWRTGTTTFAAAAGASTFTVGITTVDATTGPPARATNVADAITFSGASKTYISATDTITTAAWNTTVPTTGTSTIANGDEIALCFQMVTRSGADSVLVSAAGLSVTQSYPMITTFTGGAYASASQAPNAIITFSDGAKGYFVGGQVASVSATAITWNNTSGQKEYGNILQFPYPVKIFGAYAGITGTGDFDLNIYSDPLASGAGPTNSGSISFDVNKLSTAAVGVIQANFATPYSLPAATNIAVVARPTSASNIIMSHLTFNASGDQAAWQGTGYAVSRATVAAATAFAAQNSSKDRFAIGLLLGAFDDAVSAGGGGPMMNPSLEGL